MGKFVDLTGRRFGKLVVIERAGYSTDKSGRKYIMWKCQCDCGNTKELRSNSLLGGGNVSCGCMYHAIRKKDSVKTNKNVRRLYMIWAGMKQRCYNENCESYKWYGAKGVSVCREWINDFRSFEKWSYDSGYKENLSIERKDPKGDYEPSNCEWIELPNQQDNKRNTVRIKINGKYFTLKEISELYGINRATLYSRYSNGASVDELLKPVGTAKKKHARKNTLRVTIGDETHTIYEWSEMYGISPSTLYNRFLTGKTGKDFIAKSRKKTANKNKQ